jgi:hypothetical protein
MCMLYVNVVMYMPTLVPCVRMPFWRPGPTKVLQTATRCTFCMYASSITSIYAFALRGPIGPPRGAGPPCTCTFWSCSILTFEFRVGTIFQLYGMFVYSIADTWPQFRRPCTVSPTTRGRGPSFDAARYDCHDEESTSGPKLAHKVKGLLGGGTARAPGAR